VKIFKRTVWTGIATVWTRIVLSFCFVCKSFASMVNICLHCNLFILMFWACKSCEVFVSWGSHLYWCIPLYILWHQSFYFHIGKLEGTRVSPRLNSLKCLIIVSRVLIWQFHEEGPLTVQTVVKYYSFLHLQLRTVFPVFSSWGQLFRFCSYMCRTENSELIVLNLLMFVPFFSM
jgi:hypothetical protein